MPNRRYRKTTIINTDEEYYSSLVSKRGVKNVDHHVTPFLNNPTVGDRRRIKTIPHIWRYGDRLYKLADQYYGDSRYWWVIAWWNGYSLEADIKLGSKLLIPVNLEEALTALGV
jgi:nucleoid-associated protein YgaU